jgi:hypothetical protein
MTLEGVFSMFWRHQIPISAFFKKQKPFFNPFSFFGVLQQIIQIISLFFKEVEKTTQN